MVVSIVVVFVLAKKLRIFILLIYKGEGAVVTISGEEKKFIKGMTERKVVQLAVRKAVEECQENVFA